MKKLSINKFSQRLLAIMPDIKGAFVARIQKVLTKDVISLPQMVILGFLYKKHSCTMSNIAGILSVSMSAATGLVDRMIKNNFLKRKRSAKDRRIVRIALTPKGKKISRRIMQEQFKLVKQLFGKLTNAERETYLKIIEKIHAQIEKKNLN